MLYLARWRQTKSAWLSRSVLRDPDLEKSKIMFLRNTLLAGAIVVGNLCVRAQANETAIGHDWPRFTVNTVSSVAVAYAGKTALKAMINEERPDHSDNHSFPSGHAAMAFAAARSIDKEFRKDCVWIPIAGYAAATAIGVERVLSDRHHWYDVVAGAGLGFGAAELTWWLSDKLFGRGSNIAIGTTGNTVDLVYNF